LGLPVLLWGCLNLLFSTSLGAGLLCDKIEQRTGMPCRLESATWSPWAGVTISQFRVFAPDDKDQKEAFLSVGETRVDLSWSSLLEGQKRWERLEVDELDVHVSIETLRGILARSVKAPAQSPGGVQPPNENLVPDPAPDPAPDPEVQSVDQKTTERPVVREDAPVKPEKESSTSMAVDDFEGLVVVSNARVEIYSERVPSLSLTLEKIEGEIPLWGGIRKGEISCEKIGISEGISEEGLTIPLEWNARSLSVMEHSLKVFGLDLKLSAVVKVAPGFPLGFQLDLPDQQLDLSSIFRGRKSPVSIGNLTSKNRLQGYLLFPSSFKGSSVTRFENMVIEDPRDEGEIRFDRGGASLVGSVAGVVARDIRAIGEEDAVLVNGFASAVGEAAATVRIVSSPERAQSHAKRVRMAEGNLLMDFEPLVTPDREFRDIRIEARDGALMMDLGEDRSWVSFFATAKALLGRQTEELPNLP
jgi:hypothetical protein